MKSYLDRSKELIGEAKIKSFEDKVIMIVGLGGVGGTAFEALVRSGFKHFIIVDHDDVDITNLNRQVIYTLDDVNTSKVDKCEAFAKSISKDIVIEKYKVFFDEESANIFKDKKIDFVIDAIDKPASKKALIRFAIDNNIKFISSLGMGNRIDPECVKITTLNKTENCPLAKIMRTLLRKDNIDLKLVPVVFSNETPIVKLDHPASMIMVPSTAGLLIAKYVITNID